MAEEFQTISDMLNIVHASSYYDGPEEGLCIHEGEPAWFKCIEEDYEENPEYDRTRENDNSYDVYPCVRIRRFHIYRLTPEQLEWQEHWITKFRNHVGTHWDYVDGKRPVPSNECIRPRTEHDNFYSEYEKHKHEFDLTDNEIIHSITERI